MKDEGQVIMYAYTTTTSAIHQHQHSKLSAVDSSGNIRTYIIIILSFLDPLLSTASVKQVEDGYLPFLTL